MANYQLNTGGSVVVTVTDTDDVTGATVTPDAGSVSFSLSNSTDSFVTNADGTFTVTAGTALGTANTVTVNATVGGVASKAGVGTYDVVAAGGGGGTTNPTTLSVSFGTKTGPTGTTAPLSAAQVAALNAAGIPFTAYPLTAAQTAALVAAGVPSPGFPVAAAGTVGVQTFSGVVPTNRPVTGGLVAGEIDPATGLVNP